MDPTLSNSIRIGILGASGYTGAELVRLLARHPYADIVVMTADSNAGEPYEKVYPHLGGLNLPALVKVDEVKWDRIDVDTVFCGLPHGNTQEFVASLMHNTQHSVLNEITQKGPDDTAKPLKKTPRIIDLSADFRLEDFDTYAKYYGHEHFAPHLQPEAIYGLTEMYREQLADACLVACPGCYPTVAILTLAPLLAAQKISPEDIIIDAKTGITGAGRSAKAANLFSEVSEGLHAYGISSHRHGPEIEQELSKASGDKIKVNFTPHLAPMNRGILASSYVRLAGSTTADDLRDCLRERYADEPFVRVVTEGVAPATRDVRGSNYCLIGVFADRLPGRAIIISVLDNLVKGSSGQAIQNMNIMFDLPEATGLEQEALFP